MKSPENANGQGPGDGPMDPVRLILYVAGDDPNSISASENIREICRSVLQGRCELEVVDVLAEPSRALKDGIILTPTLLRLSPPMVRILGDLSEREKVVNALGLRNMRSEQNG